MNRKKIDLSAPAADLGRRVSGIFEADPEAYAMKRSTGIVAAICICIGLGVVMLLLYASLQFTPLLPLSAILIFGAGALWFMTIPPQDDTEDGHIEYDD